MKIIVSVLSFTLILGACSNKSNETRTVKMHAAPASVDAAARLVKGKYFKTEKIAGISPFETDKENPYVWMDEKADTTKFFRDYLAERLAFTLRFVNDTAVTVTDKDKMIDATYVFDEEIREKEKKGVKLRISYVDSAMRFPGSTEAVTATYSYLVAGADDTGLLLETPYGYNRRNIAVWMKAE